MDVPRHTSPLFRLLSVVVVTGAVVIGGASSGQASPSTTATPVATATRASGASTPAPRTSAQALAQLRAFNDQFELVTEQYNDAQIVLAQRRIAAQAADRRAKKAEAQYAAMVGQVRRLVAVTNQSDPFSRVGVLFTSGSAEQFVEKLKALDYIASRRGTLLQDADRAQAAAGVAKAQAKTALTAADTLTRRLAAQRDDLSKRAAQSQKMFDTLSAKERADFLAAQTAADQARASRAAARTAATTTAAPAATATATATTPAPVSVPASDRAAVAVAAAKAQLGKPYVWAAAGPDSFDCSGLTMYVWAKAGVSLPHSSRLQIGVGTQVSESQLEPGDLVFFGSPIHHVGIYVGNGEMIHAPQTGDVVKYTSIAVMSDYAGATRPG